MRFLTHRRTIWICLSIALLTGIIPALVFTHINKTIKVHAANITPTISPAVSTAHGNEKILVTGQGFPSNTTIPMQLDGGISAPFLGNLACDSNGNCSGTAQLPKYPGPMGEHQLIATGGPGAFAQAPIMITPAVFGSSGGPGAPVNVIGDGFAVNESVQIYWGKSNKGVLEGNVTADWNGYISFKFTSPTGLTPGLYPITVVRPKQQPATLTTAFTVLQPVMRLSRAGIHSGQAVTVTLKGFQALEPVNLSWNVNGGLSLGTFTSAFDGSLQADVTPPFAPLGSYILTATGSSSGIKAITNLNVGPGLLIAPSPVIPGETVDVLGGGYTPGETVVIHGPSAMLFTTIADLSGKFDVVITAPKHYNPMVADFVYANSRTGIDKAKAPIYFVTPEISLNYQGYSSFGTLVPVNGQGFLPGERVTFYFDFQNPVKAGIASVAPDGTFTGEITIPSNPFNGFYINLKAVGATSKLQASIQISSEPGIYSNPIVGYLGKMITIYGGSFYANEQVTVMFGQYTESPVTTDANGAFSLSFVAPTTTEGGGSISVYATDGRNKAYTWFLIPSTLHISPNTGPSGTKIVVTGTFFQATFQYTIAWYDPANGSLTSLGAVITDNYGNLSATVNAPTNIVHGHTYRIVVLEYKITSANSTTFTAQ